MSEAVCDLDATTTAVGSPRAASAAKDGPESTANRSIEFVPRAWMSNCDSTSLMRRLVSGSRPLVALTIAASGGKYLVAAENTLRTCAEGIAQTTIAVFSSASWRCDVIDAHAGILQPGR